MFPRRSQGWMGKGIGMNESQISGYLPGAAWEEKFILFQTHIISATSSCLHHPQHLCCRWWRDWRKMTCDHLLYLGHQLALGTQRELRPNFSPTDTHSLDGDVNYKRIMTTQGSNAIKTHFTRIWEQRGRSR